jgi:hypothetical protein
MANKKIALIAILAIAMWSFGFGFWTHVSEAAALTFVSDTLSDSDLGVTSNHTIVFSSASGIALGETILITFPGEFNVSTGTLALATDVDIDHGSGDLTVDTAVCAAQDASLSFSGTQAIQIEICAGGTGNLGAGGTTTIEIGSHAASGVGDITNPTSAGSYAISIAGTQTDSGEMRVAIIDDVVVTASVDTIFEFAINGIPAGSSVNGSPTTTADASTATTLPFGTITPGLSKTLAQNLTVNTNAANGFTVTVSQDQNLTSSTGADIDSFIDNAATASSTAWVGPLGTLGSENTYGHMGITSEDETPSAPSEGFYDDLWAGNFVDNPREVFYHDGPADGVTAHQGSTTVGFQVDIMALQEAGSDYTANLTYVATPVF